MQIYLPIAELPVNVLLILFMGLAVGFISGMFGIGGGFLMTPLLIFIGISAGGRGRERREPRGGLLVLRRDLLLAPARARSCARHDAAGRRPDRHHRRRLAVHAAAPARPARPDDRGLLPDAARHRRQHDDRRKRARDPARARRAARPKSAAPAATCGSTACR